ncbi:hypothetical protein ACP70R_021253 [Stipagrostis hirtigluma subsp. patula]
MPTPRSAAGDVAGPGSASAIVGDTASGYHLLHIDGYSRTKEELPTGQFIKSRPFSAAGRSWRILYYPNGATSTFAEFIAIFLYLDESDAEPPVKARATFSLLDRAGNPVASHTRSKGLFSYSVHSGGHGLHDFIKREFLEKSEHLLDDCFKIRCDVVVAKELRTEDRAVASPSMVVPPPDLNRHLSDLLTGEDGDVTFRVAGETFRAHRFLLAVRSPVFKAELFGSMRESAAIGGYIQIDDMLAEVFKNLLHFVYTDTLPGMEEQEEAVMAQHLLEAADRYDMQRLKVICEQKLCSHLDVSTAATTLVLAEQHRCHRLKEACIEFLKSPNTLDAVMETDGFEHLTKSCPALLRELMSKLSAR